MPERKFSPEVVRRLRTDLGLSQYGLASKAGTYPAVICAWELGRRRPGAELLPKLAAALDVPIDALFVTAEDGVAE